VRCCEYLGRDFLVVVNEEWQGGLKPKSHFVCWVVLVQDRQNSGLNRDTDRVVKRLVGASVVFEDRNRPNGIAFRRNYRTRIRRRLPLGGFS
jgi:hypothetical protein